MKKLMLDNFCLEFTKFLKKYPIQSCALVLVVCFLLGDKFEKKFANFNEAKYCVGVNSGHDALKIALMSNKIGKDDLVIVPSQKVTVGKNL